MIYVVGIGPGKKDHMTLEAIEVIERCDIIVGYKTYIDLIRDLVADKIVVENGMRQEIDRSRAALDLSKKGHIVAMISGGDSGVYGMAGLVYELNTKEEWGQEIRIVQGVTSSISAAAELGAPLMNDFCHISLSDLMTPMDHILKRLELAAQGDFVICLYNPKSKGRPDHLRRAFEVMARYKSSHTPVGIVKNAGRDNMEKYVMTFENMDYDICDMSTMVIIGNKESYIENDSIITPRGYRI
ncbi:Cobalt-precorrin-3B C(17)-methyltransferase [Peptostreptococcus anaerobius]|uniref:Cobalt-precorrin-3B C(17)-methyltransferase n=1 Tax=Peptostreptococcus anaerobius TaxID=1261 RepID=A0A379CD03_9FIRM|nr:precorrin-3B C(17)-methyltransferase [Peptostreptococcus anaerobius]EKX93377.1 precorrin-3B C(17)-methyltransferase [Peptostreptococcus anaerobius VPI 4330 = DSM 2949]SFN13705.1 cobalt-precorrin 3 C17-methyltransferase [Peptostreptococcus anaerobius]SUB60302.1 Cobalt-precorrin-3B C(17)-methyltransferase [Peptostreptococcus anaerobius]